MARKQTDPPLEPLGDMISKANEVAKISSPAELLSTPLLHRSTGEMQELAAKCTDLSIEALEAIVRGGDKDSDRIAAAIALLDRAHGKPTQQVSIRTNDGATLKDAVAFMERRRNELAIEGAMVVAEEENNAVAPSNEER